MKSVLEVRGLEKSYGRRKVVNGVSFTVGESEIVGLLGPNGAGKSTSFKMTCGIVQPDRGQVFLGDQEVTEWPMFRRASEGRMGYLAQESSVFRKLTVEQNILAIFELLGVPSGERKKRTEELLRDFEITHIRRSKAGRLSGGERRRLEIARCLVTDPQIVMLDEPFAGIDPVTVQNIQQIIVKLRERGIAILITDHAAREILQTVDRCYVISKGQVLCEGDPEEVMLHPDVQKEYLGHISENFQRAVGTAASQATTRPAMLSLRKAPEPAEENEFEDEDENENENENEQIEERPAVLAAPHGWFRRSSPKVDATGTTTKKSDPAPTDGKPSRSRPTRRRTDV